jgi:ABC-type Mn2+/Zn2+ transport system ATPase subunit
VAVTSSVRAVIPLKSGQPVGQALDDLRDVPVVVMMGRYGHQGFTRRTSRADRAAVDLALDRVELSEFANRQIGRLSGGRRKRAFVARGIAQGADTMLLDGAFPP